MFKLEIRRPGDEDIQKLHRFFENVLKHTYDKEGLSRDTELLEKEIDEKRTFLKEDIASDGKDKYFLIALHKGRVIATAECGPATPTVIECTKGKLKDITEVGTVFVHPDYQGRGLGTLMLNMICITLLGRGEKEFCLDSGFKNAQKVWEKKFGKPEYVVKDYWGKGRDHKVWIKPIIELPITFRM